MNDIESVGMCSTGVNSKMPHSHSTPAGVDGGSRTPPATPRKAGKMLAVRVQMLDDSVTMFQVQAKALGRVLFDQVCKQLNLLEADYFGLEYQELNGTKYWLDLEKPVCRQVGLTLVDPLLRFCVKFYTPDPAQLEEEFTRYLYCLQIKRDLAQGTLQCNDNTAALMASYIVQAECGDYVIEDYPDHTYLSTYKFVPHQDMELERRIMENHKKHAGQSPAEADLNLLETARRCELYGMKMHPAKDHEGVPLNLAVAHMGIVVFQNYTKINTFSWAKIRKISFKRKRFLIKLHPEGYGYYKDTVEFFFEGRNECKNFWKKCVENHGFFRCSAVKHVVRQKTRVLSRGSSFRYSGKTQKQIVEFVRDNYVKRQTFQRSNSFRQTSSGRALQGSEGGGYRGATPSSSLMGSSSISAHPLLPLGDPALATPALSLSYGSMTLDFPTTATSASTIGMDRRREDTATSYRTLTSIDVHSPATPNLVQATRQHRVNNQQRTLSTGRISPSNSSPPEFPPPRPLPRHPWQRSASCRDLYASSFEDSGKARSRNDTDSKNSKTLEPFQLPSQGELDRPVTRYDETNRSYSAASSKLPSLDHDPIPEKVYSSSYPGTSSLSTESGHEESGPAGDLSHDDLSHDSYELLEREHEFEYPESYSSPQDDPASENSDQSPSDHQELFQMDAETESFVKHNRVKNSGDKQQPFRSSVLIDSKTNAKMKSIDWYAEAVKPDAGLHLVESRIQRSNTQTECTKIPTGTESVDEAAKNSMQREEMETRDPLVMRVEKQKMNVLIELKDLKNVKKSRNKVITHVDSEVLRDEGIMRPKSRIDDDISPVDGNIGILDHDARRPMRAKSIASLDEKPPRPHATHVETGSLGRGHRSRERKLKETEAKMEKLLSKMQEKERRSLEREERKRIERENSREARRLEKADSRERRSMERRSMERGDSRESRRSYERLDSSERSYDWRERSCERLDFTGRSSLRGSTEYLDRNIKPNRTTPGQGHDRMEQLSRASDYSFDSMEAIRSRNTRATLDYGQRHTLERFDSGNRSPMERVSRHEMRGQSTERLESWDRRAFDFDPKTIERLNSEERNSSANRSEPVGFERIFDEVKFEQRDGRHSVERLDSRERKSLELQLSPRDRKSLERLDRQNMELRKSIERIENSAVRDTKRSRSNLDRKPERGKSEEKPRERDDWKSLEKARKDDEKREKDRLARLSMESRSESNASIASNEKSNNGKTIAVFTEYDPKVVGGVVLGFDDNALPAHTPVERTKSDPNPARQRLGSNSKRHMLTHQKSIDLTPADSGDEDAFLSSTPAPKCQVDIPYTLRKRHVMNGTASDEKSESDSGKASRNANAERNLAKDVLDLPVRGVMTDESCLDLTKLSPMDKSTNLSPDQAKAIVPSPDKTKTGTKLSPNSQKLLRSASSPADKSPLKSSLENSSAPKITPKSVSTDKAAVSPNRTVTKKSLSLDKVSSGKSSPSKVSPNEANHALIERKSPRTSMTASAGLGNEKKTAALDRNAKSLSLNKLSNFLGSRDIVEQSCNESSDVKKVTMEKSERSRKQRLAAPENGIEKQDSVESMPLPGIPLKFIDEKPPLPVKQRLVDKETLDGSQPPEKPPLPPKQHLIGKLMSADRGQRIVDGSVLSKDLDSGIDGTKGSIRAKSPNRFAAPSNKDQTEARVNHPDKPSIPEKTKRILEKIESRFTELKKNSPAKVTKPKIIDTGYDDFVDPVAELPLDEVPVKPALELDSLKVPEFLPFVTRPHAEPLRCKSLSLAEEKAPIDTLLSPELENKSFVQDISPKRSRSAKSDQKRDFKKQSKSLEADKPPLKKSGSRESKMSPASSKIDKSKLKVGEMPQEIIIIESTDVEPEISIVQKGRSKSVTRLSDRSFSSSKDEKDESSKRPRVKSASVDDELIKGPGTLKSDKPRPKSLGITKSLGSTDKDSIEKTSPKRGGRVKTSSKSMDCPRSFLTKGKSDAKSDSEVEKSTAEESAGTADESTTPQEVVKESTSKVVVKDQVLCGSGPVIRRTGQNPGLFGRSGLGLSEGSGIGTLQRQSATQSPSTQRRAKSLDAPVISLHRLPAANAFSSKDDTVDMSEENQEHENLIEDGFDYRRGFKAHSIPMEASPNHKSESTDHTTVPDICTDSLSVTETSAQYLESPLTECNEIIACPDLIPYEMEAHAQSVSRCSSRETLASENKMETITSSDTKFIDQSSVESGADQEIPYEESDGIEESPVRKSDVESRTDQSSETDSSSNARDRSPRKKESVSGKTDPCEKIDTNNKVTARTETWSSGTSKGRIGTRYHLACMEHTGETEGMVKSPVQISIEECSDDDEDRIQGQEEADPVDETRNSEKARLDSGDTSEDTLDALDSQGQGCDRESSSPDYGVEKTDEKTLVEVELTSEYLEMKREDDEVGAEELPEDEPIPVGEKKPNERLGIEKMGKLGTDRSRSEETTTWMSDREDPDSSSCSIARPLGIGQIQPIVDRGEIAIMKETRKEGSLEDESSSNSLPVPKMELSSTWKPFPLESSGSSSLEDGWFPPDDGNRDQQQQSRSEDDNGQNEDSFQEDLMDFPSGFGYGGPDILANYGSAFSLSRTLSRISERSTTSEQDKSELEDSFKPSSRSPSLDDESLISSDHQPSLSSDPPSGTALPSVSDDRRTSSELPDIPIDLVESRDDAERSPQVRSKLQFQASEDWPSPPTSPLFDTPVVSHVETFYMEMKSEEAVKVTVTDSTETPELIGVDSDSSDENRTLHDDLHSGLLEDGQSSVSATTIDGTVRTVAVKPKSNSYITGSSHSEDTSMGLSMSEWSSSNSTVRQYCQYSGTKSDDNSLAELGASISDWSGSTTVVPQQFYSSTTRDKSHSDTTTSEKSVTSMRPNSKCHIIDGPTTLGSCEDLETDDVELDDFDEEAMGFRESMEAEEAAQFDEARKFVASQFDKHQFDGPKFDDSQIPRPLFTDISPPQITFRNEYDETVDHFDEECEDFDEIPDIPGPIPEEDEEQLYDNVPAMKYSSNDHVRMEVTRGDSSEDMHERYASLASRTRYGYEGSTMEDQRMLEEKLRKRFHEKPLNRFERGYSEPNFDPRHVGGTRSTERPVVVPIRAKSTPYYSTTSLSGESTTSSPPMQVKAQIRTKTMTYSSSRSPQSEGDTSSSMDSPGHTPDRGARAFRRKRQQNIKRRHRVVVDLEVKDARVVSSTDSSFDVANIPPPLFPDQGVDDDEEVELFITKSNGRQHND